MLKQKKIFISDLLIFITIFIIFCTGIITVYSATYDENINFSFLFIKQLFGFFSGILLFFFFSYVNHTSLISWGSFLHKIVLLMLCFTLFKGRIALGGQRWIDLGFIKFQPSELAKITLPLYIAFYLMKYVFQKISIKQWIHLLLTSFFTFFLIAKQPDLGSGLIVLLSSLIILFDSDQYTVYSFYLFLHLSKEQFVLVTEAQIFIQMKILLPFLALEASIHSLLQEYEFNMKLS